MMLLEEFQIMHSETILYFQKIEWNIKGILAMLQPGDMGVNFKNTRNKTFSRTLNELEKMDKKQNLSCFTENQYKNLKKMATERNFWCHECFIYMLYPDGIENLIPNIKQIEPLLIRDHKVFESISQEVERVRITLIKKSNKDIHLKL